MEKPKKISCDRTIASLTPDQLANVEKRCKDDQYSTGGFLTADQSLVKVIEDDLAYLKSVSITTTQIVDFLKYLLDAVTQIKHTETLTTKCTILSKDGWSCRNKHSNIFMYDGKKYEVHMVVFGGSQECPFLAESDAHGRYFGYNYGDREIEVVNAKGDRVIFSTLHLHMIEIHSFFEGPGVRYRLDPKMLVEFFELKTGSDYNVQRVKIKRWTMASASDLPDFEDVKGHTPTTISGADFYLLRKKLYVNCGCKPKDTRIKDKLDKAKADLKLIKATPAPVVTAELLKAPKEKWDAHQRLVEERQCQIYKLEDEIGDLEIEYKDGFVDASASDKIIDTLQAGPRYLLISDAMLDVEHVDMAWAEFRLISCMYLPESDIVKEYRKLHNITF